MICITSSGLLTMLTSIDSGSERIDFVLKDLFTVLLHLCSCKN